MRKHLSTLFLNGKEIFRGPSALCNQEICRILATHGVYQFQRKFYKQDGTETPVNLSKGEAPEFGLKRIADSKKKAK